MDTQMPSTPAVSKALGIGFQRLDHWWRKGYIPGAYEPGSGYVRRWTPEQIEVAENLVVIYRLWGDNYRHHHNYGPLLTLVRNLRAMGLDPLELAGVNREERSA